MLHVRAANIRCDRYCSNFLEVGVELNKGLVQFQAPFGTVYLSLKHRIWKTKINTQSQRKQFQAPISKQNSRPVQNLFNTITEEASHGVTLSRSHYFNVNQLSKGRGGRLFSIYWRTCIFLRAPLVREFKTLFFLLVYILEKCQIFQKKNGGLILLEAHIAFKIWWSLIY